jgi:phosphohistidine phosphatase SixA
MAAVRLGGTVLVCRHAKTTSFNEREPVDYEDESTQRLLSREGERQSAAMGRAILSREIAVSEVIASPMQRARRTAELMFERPVVIDSSWHTNGSTYPEAPRQERIAMLESPPSSGNRIIISHIGTMGSVLPLEGRRVREGDCVVVSPGGSAFTFLGVVPYEAWGGRGR